MAQIATGDRKSKGGRGPVLDQSAKETKKNKQEGGKPGEYSNLRAEFELFQMDVTEIHLQLI